MQNKISAYIITGVSGSGKSTALKALEDLGFYCSDNIPTILLPEFFKTLQSYSQGVKNIAVGVDVREQFFLEKFPEVYLSSLKNIKGLNLKIIYIDASDDVIIRRFKETRRIHPLKAENYLEGLKIEREKLSFIKANADIYINTTNFNVHNLQKFIYNNLKFDSEKNFKVNIVSFGFKNGILSEADLIFDVRFLRNPYFVSTLRDKTGNEKEVTDYIFTDERAGKFIAYLENFLKFILPEFIKEGKIFSIIGIGCTGGMHRSVAIANRIGTILEKQYNIFIRHRDI